MNEDERLRTQEQSTRLGSYLNHWGEQSQVELGKDDTSQILAHAFPSHLTPLWLPSTLPPTSQLSHSMLIASEESCDFAERRG